VLKRYAKSSIEWQGMLELIIAGLDCCPQLSFRMGCRGPDAISAYVATYRLDEHAIPSLRNAIVSSVHRTPVNHVHRVTASKGLLQPCVMVLPVFSLTLH
jgi:hypothetical protein